jgi:NADP-dependent 3-hydroxy acid dehydrogenase YdfG
MNRIILAYCQQNRSYAELLDQQLRRIGIPFEHISDQAEGAFGVFSQQLQQCTEPVLLIVTDNMLKSQACMTDLYAAVQALISRNQLVIAVAPGTISKDGGATFEATPTHFDRMVYALQYMNYWQNTWLDLSTQQMESPQSGDKLANSMMLDASRKVANEIGELISTIRDFGYIWWEDLLAHDFQLFFQKFGLEQWHAVYIEQKNTQPETIQVVQPEISQPEPILPDPAPDSANEAIPVVMEEKPATLQSVAVASGMLTPIPLEPIRVAKETPDFAGIDALLAEMPLETIAEVPALEEEAAAIIPEEVPAIEALQELNKENYSETEIQQAIQDAWLWIDKGHVEQGLELLHLSLDQHPDHAGLRAALAAANARFPAFNAESIAETPNIEEQNHPAAPVNDVPVVQGMDEETRSYAYMGDRAEEKGDYLFAKYCWDRVAELDPQYPNIYRKLALMTHEHLRDYKETTVLYLNNALKANPEDPEVLLAMAEIFQANGQVSSAEAYYLKTLSLQPAFKTPERDRLFLPHVPEMEPVLPETPPEAIPTPTPELVEIESTTPVVPAIKSEILTILITGASSGIGKATAELFARHGHRLILTGRRADRLSAVKSELEQGFNTEVLLLPFDVRDQHTVQAVVDALPEAWQEIDILINNAGLAKGLAPIHEGSIDHWETMIDTNIKGLLYVTRAVAPGMVKRKKGHIINIGSSAGKEVYPNGGVYCATKFAVDALTRAMRMDLYTHQIRVSQVSPGHVEETEFAITRFDGDAERAKIYEGFQPLKASDIAETIYFIATRPPHVNIQDVFMFSSQQASSMMIDRSGR